VADATVGGAMESNYNKGRLPAWSIEARARGVTMKKAILSLILAACTAPALLAADARPKAVIPAGTTIDVTLITSLSTSANKSGDGFRAEIEQPIFSGGQEIVTAGSTLRGHVAFVKPAGRVSGKGEMRLVADTIVTKDGHEFDFSGTLTNSASSPVKAEGSEGTVQGPGKSGKQAAKDAGIGAAIGAGAGEIGDGGKGAAIGAGAGALVGLIKVLAGHHKGVVLQSGTPLTFVLTSAATETDKVSKSNAASAPFVCPTCGN
jgi:hypothetical protein